MRGSLRNWSANDALRSFLGAILSGCCGNEGSTDDLETKLVKLVRGAIRPMRHEVPGESARGVTGAEVDMSAAYGKTSIPRTSIQLAVGVLVLTRSLTGFCSATAIFARLRIRSTSSRLASLIVTPNHELTAWPLA